LTIVFPPADLAAVKVAAVFALNFDAYNRVWPL